MRRPLGALLGFGLIAPLVPLSPLAIASPAEAAVLSAPAPVTQVVPAAVVRKDPFSRFKVSVRYDKSTKRAGKITYYIKAKNLGPYAADYFGVGGQLPKGVKPTLRWGGPKGTQCVWQGQIFLCVPKYQVPVGGTTWLKFQLTLKSNTKGTAKGRVGVIAYDLPTGAENIDQEELARIGGLKGHLFMKPTTTKIVWPQRKRKSGGGSGYTPPPPPPQWTPPANNSHVERNEKKDT